MVSILIPVLGQASENQNPDVFFFRESVWYRSNDAALVEGVDGLFDPHCIVGLSHVASRIHECVTSSEISKTAGQQRVLSMLQSQEDFATYNLSEKGCIDLILKLH